MDKSKKVKTVFYCYVQHFCEAFDGKTKDSMLIRNFVKPLVNFYRKNRNYFDNNMKFILYFVLEAVRNRQTIKKEHSKIGNYCKAMKESMGV